MKYPLSTVLSFLLLLAQTAQAIVYPVGITNCHYQQWFDKKPERVAVASSGAVEIMLALDLADSIIHTSWVTEVWEPLDSAFQKLQQYPKYPTAEEFKVSNPDMIYATYSSAFENSPDPERIAGGDRLNYTEMLGLAEPCNLLITTNSYGDNMTYCREEIHDAGINTYLASSYCEVAEHRPADTSIDALYQEIWDIAIIFDAIDNARTLVDGIEDHFQLAHSISEVPAVGSKGEAAQPMRVFWLDTFKNKNNPDETRPFVGACCGGPQIVLDKSGAENVFATQGLDDRRIWDRVEWEAVVEADPDLIVLIELSTESAGTYILFQWNFPCF